MASLRWFPRQGGDGVTPRGRFSHDGDWSSDSEGGRREGVNSGWRAASVAAPLGAVIVLNSALITSENHAECNAPVQTAAEVVAEQVHTAKMHAQLCTELQKVRAERDALDEQRHALQTALGQRTVLPASTVVQQEVAYAESWNAKIADLLAARTTERVLAVLQQPHDADESAAPFSSIMLGAVSDEGLDLSREPGLAETASTEQAQSRLRALLTELHERTRLEGARLSEAMRATEEAAVREHLMALKEKIEAQEAYVNRLVEAKVEEIGAKTMDDLLSRDADFRRQLRQQWVKINEESHKLAQHSAQLKLLRRLSQTLHCSFVCRELEKSTELVRMGSDLSLNREDDMTRAKKVQADFFAKKAKGTARQLLQTRDTMRELDEAVADDAVMAAEAQVVHQLAVTVQGLMTDVCAQRPITDHVMSLRKLAALDSVVATVVTSIPSEVVKQGVVSDGELQERYLGAAHEALRRLLVRVLPSCPLPTCIGSQVAFLWETKKVHGIRCQRWGVSWLSWWQRCGCACCSSKALCCLCAALSLRAVTTRQCSNAGTTMSKTSS